MTFWTPHRVDQLKALFADGLTGSQIQREMGAASRNVIIGKVTRLGLTRDLKPRPARPPRIRKPRPPTPPAPRKGGLQFSRMKQLAAHTPAPPIAPAPAATNPQPIWRPCSVLELNATRCRWPCACDVGDSGFHFCGGPPVNGSPYCAAHTRIAYRRPGEREEAA